MIHYLIHYLIQIYEFQDILFELFDQLVAIVWPLFDPIFGL